jgi:HPt (histidine-containing phosphotransfer) domain-containing protein
MTLNQPSTGVLPELELVIDKNTMLDHFEGDCDLLQEIVTLFHKDYPKRLAEVRTALARQDAMGVAFGAHSLKGSLSNFAAGAAVDSALRLEVMARRGDLSHADETLAILEEEINRVVVALAEFLRSRPRHEG